MLRILHNPHKNKFPERKAAILLQTRWRKPADSAQTRLESRTRDPRLDRLAARAKNLKKVLKLQELMSKARRGFTSVQIMSRWRNIVGINTPIGDFLRKYPHVFETYAHPSRRNPVCRVSKKFSDLVLEEEAAVEESGPEAVRRLAKLLMMSADGALHVHALWLARRELGLPDGFRDSVLSRHPDIFRMVYPDTVVLVERDEDLAGAEVEKWREKEYREKWLSEFETKYAFPIHFPTGFRIERGSRERMRNWQRLAYMKPYEKKEGTIRVRTCGGMERFEKRAVGVLHELLSLTVEKMVEVERLAHFRRDFNMEVNVRELLLKHPGIFYISTKGDTQTVFLREAYSKGCLLEPNPIYAVRRKMLDLILLGSRNAGNANLVQPLEESSKDDEVIDENSVDASCDEDWVMPILPRYGEQPLDSNGSNLRDA